MNQQYSTAFSTINQQNDNNGSIAGESVNGSKVNYAIKRFERLKIDKIKPTNLNSRFILLKRLRSDSTEYASNSKSCK